jgi:predicted transcriptional regulator
MSETQASQRNIAEMTARIENIEGMVTLDLSANPHAKDRVRELFEERKGSAEVYLALDEPKGQDRLQKELGLSQASVSKIVNFLYENGLVQKVRLLGSVEKFAYAKGRYDNPLRITKAAKEKLSRGKVQGKVGRGGKGA